MLLGQAKRSRCQFRHLGSQGEGLAHDFPAWHEVVEDANAVRDVSRDHVARQGQLDVLRQPKMHGHQVGTDDAGKTGLDFRLAEFHFGKTDAQVGAKCDLQSRPRCHAVERHDARLVEIAHGSIHRVLPSDPGFDVVDRVPHDLLDVLPGAEGTVAFAGQDYRTNVPGLVEFREQRDERLAHLHVHGIEDFRPVERDDRNRIPALQLDAVCHLYFSV